MLCLKAANGEFYCPNWYIYTLPSIGIYFIVLLLLLLTHFVRWYRSKKAGELYAAAPARRKHNYFVCYRLYDFAFSRNKPGQSLVSQRDLPIDLAILFAISTLSLVSFVLYLVDVANANLHEHDDHVNNTENMAVFLKLDIGFNAAFFLHFMLRLLAASSKLWFWLSWKTAVDVATIPACVMYLIFSEYWTGLRFFRAMYILSIPDILQSTGLLRNDRKIRLVQIMLQFLTLWLISAGLVHMFENNGDPWLPYFNGQSLSYFGCVYFLIITSSTVGYGDVVCKTALGRLFNVIFVFGGLAMFTKVIPELVSMQIGSSFKGRLRLPNGKDHVVVIGHVTADSAVKFVDAFLHPDRDAKNLAVAFMHPDTPSLDFEALLKRQQNVYYFRGNEMDARDLHRVNLFDAKACIILADNFAGNPDEEDSANIMRAIAIKNLNGNSRILIQLLLERNKCHLLNIPNWNDLDAAVCLDEFKMGAIAQSCWAPGFSTLLSLLLTVSGKNEEKISKANEVETAYLNGLGLEMYATSLSSAFAGMTFTQAAELSYQRLKLVLFGIKTCVLLGGANVTASRRVILNPGQSYIVQIGDEGFFLADSSDTAARASIYCKVCHDDAEVEVTPCDCREGCSKLQKEQELSAVVNDPIILESVRLLTLVEEVTGHTGPGADLPSEANGNGNNLISTALARARVENMGCNVDDDREKASSTEGEIKERFDFMGMFYWQPKRHIEAAVLTSRAATAKNFRNHVIACVFGEPNSPTIGLRNFVMPLRSSNHVPAELKSIVFIGNLHYLQQEWEQINVFPHIYILPGSPMDRTILRALNIDLCDMCVIFSAKSQGGNRTLMDKHSILCYLNIKSMSFDAGNPHALPMHSVASELHPLSKETSECDTKCATALTPNDSARLTGALRANNNVPVIADITIPENILVLDDEVTHTVNTPLQRMYPYACGSIFAGEVLDSVISAAYFHPNLLTVVRELVTGGSTTETDQLMAEGLGFCEGTNESLIKINRNRSRIHEFSLCDPTYSSFMDPPCIFSQLFIGILQSFGYVCLAVCRLRQNGANCKSSSPRMVLVCPFENFRLKKSDKVICLQPVNI